MFLVTKPKKEAKNEITRREWREAISRKRTIMKHRQHSQKHANAPGAQGGFRLPPDVSFNKQPLHYGWAYVFRHVSLRQSSVDGVNDSCSAIP
jgi:hypothetical protein